MSKKIFKNIILISLFCGVVLNLGYIALLKAGLTGLNSTNSSGLKSGKDAGQAFITNFIFEDVFDFQSWSIVQDNQGLMLFANKKGILTYDGQKEKYVIFGKVPYALAKDPNSDKIFAGCNEGYGYLLKDQFGDYKYTSLSDSLQNLGFFSKIKFSSDKVWFYSEEMLVSCLLSDLKQSKIVIEADRDNPFSGIIAHHDQIFVNISGLGIYEISNDDKKLIPDSKEVIKSNILFSDYFDPDNSIIGTDDNQLYLFNGVSLKPFEIESKDYLTESVLSGGMNFNENQIVLYTLNGGVIIVNKKDGSTETTINYRTGLPDDEIYAAGIDENNGLWLAHEYGVSRVDINVPVKNYGSIPGIIGKITSVKMIDTTLYVTATEGVFYLSEVKDFKEIEVIAEKVRESEPNRNDNSFADNNNSVNKNTVENASTNSTVEKSDIKNTNTDETEENTTLWKRFKKKIKKVTDRNEDVKENTSDNVNENTTVDPANNTNNNTSIADKEAENNVSNETNNKAVDNTHKTNKVKKKTVEKSTEKIYEIQSVKNIFKRVEGISGKCKQVISFDNGIIVVSNSGLFYEKSGVVSPLIENKYIYKALKSEDKNEIYISSSDGLYKVFKDGTVKLEKLNFKNEEITQIFSIVEQDNETLWVGGENIAYKIDLKTNSDTLDIKAYHIESNIPENVIARKNIDKIIFFISDKVLQYDQNADSLIVEKEISQEITPKSRFIYPNREISIIKEKNKMQIIGTSSEYVNVQFNALKLFDRVDDFFIDEINNIWVLTGRNFYKILPKNELETKKNFNLFISSVSTMTDTIKIGQHIVLDYDYGNLFVTLGSPYFLKQNSVEFTYSISESETEELIWSKDPVLNLKNFAPGNYVVKFKARNIMGQISNETSMTLKITPPYWKSIWFWAIVGFVIILILAATGVIIFKKRAAIMKKRTLELEAEVERRTLEIRTQSQEIAIQNEEISKQNKEIHASIRYASLIQSAVLPESDILTDHVQGHFVLYSPRDIVSGDFYWIKKIESRIFIVAADCTGHGVPGGFLSMLGISFLNEIVNTANADHKDINAADVVQLMREKVVTSLHQSLDSKSKDGMDMSITILNMDSNTLDFAGANNPMLFVRNGQITEIEADKMPVGYQRRKMDQRYTNQRIDFLKGDTFYLMSDGFQDQFGGQNKKRFMKKRIMEVLVQIQDYDMPKQQEILQDIFNKWIADYVRVDDVLVMGVRI